MITIKNIQFAETLEESSKGTSGFADVKKSEICLMDKQMVIIGVITRYGVIAKATPVADGIWYSYGDITCIGSLSVQETSDIVKRLSCAQKRIKNETVYYFT